MVRIESRGNFCEDAVVHFEGGIFAAKGIAFVNDAVVARIKASGDSQKVAPRAAFADFVEYDVTFNTAISEEAEEYEPVKDPLGKRRETLAVEVVIAAFERLRELLPPELHLCEEFFVNGPRATGEKFVFVNAPGKPWQGGGGFVN